MRPALLLSAVCLGWGTIPFVAAEAGLPAATTAFARVAIAAGGLGLIVAVARPGGPRLLSVAPLRCVSTGVILAAHWTAMFAGYDRAPASTVIFLIFLAPVAIAAIERPHRRLVTALAIGVTGLALVAGPTFGETSGRERAGVALAVVSGGLFVVLVLLAKPLAEQYGGLRLTFLEMVVASAVLAPAAAGLGGLRAGGLPWLLVLGLVHTAVGTAIYLRTLALLPATEVGILGYLEPVGVVAFTWLLLGDAPAPATALGGVLVVAAGAVALTTPSTSLPSMEVAARVPR